MIGSAMNSGLQGIQSGLTQFNQSAQKLATLNTQTQGTDLASMAEGSVGMIQAELQVAASAEVVKVDAGLLGSLIDTKV